MPETGNSPRDWVPRPPAHLGETAVKQGQLWREKITGPGDGVEWGLARTPSTPAIYHRPDMADTALESLAEAVRSSGLIAEDSSGVALCSGGADSAALAAGLAGARGSASVLALHLNYGLRPDSDRDEGSLPRALREVRHRTGGRAPPAGGGKRAGRGARGALRGGGGGAPAAGARLGRNRPHPHRPRRDRPLPACHIARATGAARASAAPRGDRPPAVDPRSRARAGARYRGGSSLPGRPHATPIPSTPATGSATRSCPSSGSWARRPSR